MQSCPPAAEAQEAADPSARPVKDSADISNVLATKTKPKDGAETPGVTADGTPFLAEADDDDDADDAGKVQPLPLLSKSQQKKELRRLRSAQLYASKKALKKEKAAQLKSVKMEQVRERLQAMTKEERSEWEALREERRRERREQAYLKKQRLQKTLEEEGGGGKNPSSPSSLRIIIDCGYPDGMMTPSEVRSLAGQLARCVGSNARAPRAPARLCFAGIPSPGSSESSPSSPPSPSVSFSSATSRLLLERLGNIDGVERWPVRWLPSLEGEAAAAARGGGSSDDKDKNAASAAAASSSPPSPSSPPPNRKKIVYLSADSDRELSDLLDPRTTLVVGGLVDRNRHRGAAASRAASLGMETARLPLKTLGKAVLSSSGVLTVDQTFALVLAAVNAGGGGGEGGGGEEGEEQGEKETKTEPKGEATEKRTGTKMIQADWAAGVRAAVPVRKLARPPKEEREGQAAPEV